MTDESVRPCQICLRDIVGDIYVVRGRHVIISRSSGLVVGIKFNDGGYNHTECLTQQDSKSKAAGD